MVTNLTYILLIIGLVSCMGSSDSDKEEISDNHPQDPLEIKYAKHFFIDTVDGFQRVEIIDPLTGVSQYFVLVPKGMTTDINAVVIPTPVDDLSLFSVSFIAFLDELDALSSIKFIENVNYVYNQQIVEDVKSGKIKETGMPSQMDLEMLILDSPELMLLNDFPESSDYLNKALKSGIRMMPIIEWQEQHPLARAEWIKVFGALLDKESLADSLFNAIEKSYMEVVSTCSTSPKKTRAIFSSMYQGVWYMPGGESYVAQLLKDANGSYEWKENDDIGSIPLSFEEVILKSLDNDVWINPDAGSFQELYNRDGRYEEIGGNLTMGAFQADARVSSNGGNDYWESGVVRPGLILKDYGKMLHPDLFMNHDFYYFKKLN